MGAFKILLVLSLAVIYSNGQAAENDNLLTARKYTEVYINYNTYV